MKITSSPGICSLPFCRRRTVEPSYRPKPPRVSIAIEELAVLLSHETSLSGPEQGLQDVAVGTGVLRSDRGHGRRRSGV